MAYRLDCPCGEAIFGRDAAEIVDQGVQHASEKHGRQYEAEHVMFMAVEIPASFLPSELRTEGMRG